MINQAKTNTLSIIQTELVAPKGQFNSFGKYKYRSCEDILEALKPLLKKTEATLIITDEIVFIGNRVYVKALATLKAQDGEWSATSYAREAEVKKGMDESQITGATSSYARKYALNGLFCIDDSKDADSNEAHENGFIDEKQMHSIRDQIMELNIQEEKFLEHMKLSSLEKMPKADFQKALAVLEATRLKRKATNART